jgi:hypothetical protein
MKNNIMLASIASIILIFNTGCQPSSAGDMIKPEVDLKKHSAVVNNISKYTDGLENLNELMHSYNDNKIRLAVAPVENKTSAVGKLPNDITLMVNSALNEIGEKVQAYMYSDYVLANTEDLYIIEGAITEFDTLEKSKRGFQAGVHGGKGRGEYDVDGSSDDDDSLSKMTIDFNLIDARSGAYVPRVHTSNSIDIVKKSASNDFGFSILGSGFGISSEVAKEQGIHSALRLLVDLSMIELIGKFKKYPYWVCVAGGKTDTRLLRHIKKDFESYSQTKKVQHITFLLSLINKNVFPSDNLNAESKEAIINFKNKFGLLPLNDSISAELYVSLLENVAKLKADMLHSSNVNESYKGLL